MFERLLERISVSKYQDNFILKGGLLLSAIMGNQSRSTRDLDAMIKGIDIDKNKMIQVLNEILSIDLKDGVKFEMVDITNIRQEDEYGGNKYTLYARLGNTKIQLDVDISTGDIITPKELKFNYPLLFEDRKIILNSYNLSTIISEKLEIILSKGKINSRMKDYYDLYFFLNNMYININIIEVKQAVLNTFEKRGNIQYLIDYQNILKTIRKSNYIKERWTIYSKKNNYAKDIDFNDIVNLIDKFLTALFTKDLIAI